MTGKQLKRMIERAGKTQVGLAREIGISERAMRNYVAADQVPKIVELASRYICEPIIAAAPSRFTQS